MVGRIPIILFAFFIFSCQISFGQENNRELGIRFNRFTQFNLIYKKQLKPNIYRRHRGAASDFSIIREPELKVYRAGLSYSIGREIRTEIKKPFYLISGFEAFANSNFVRTAEFGEEKSTRTNIRIAAGIGLVFGFHYYFSDHLYVNVEAIPTFSKNYRYVHLNSPVNRSQTSEEPIQFLVHGRQLFFLTFAYRFHFESKKKSKVKK